MSVGTLIRRAMIVAALLAAPAWAQQQNVAVADVWVRASVAGQSATGRS